MEEVLLQDGDYLKLREVSVRYLVPTAFARRFRLYNATIYATVRNVAIWSKSDLVDPELSGIGGNEDLQLGGVTGNTLSPPRQFRIGLLVTL